MVSPPMPTRRSCWLGKSRPARNVHSLFTAKKISCGSSQHFLRTLASKYRGRIRFLSCEQAPSRCSYRAEFLLEQRSHPACHCRRPQKSPISSCHGEEKTAAAARLEIFSWQSCRRYRYRPAWKTPRVGLRGAVSAARLARARQPTLHAPRIGKKQHADKIIERIIFLDGFPNMQTFDALHIGQTVKQVVERDLQAEMEARALYEEAATHCHSVKDYVTRDLFEELMHDEEEHIDFLEARRLELHYVPKHASWLNMVEIEIGLRGQCLDRRIGERDRLVSEIAAWERQRNATGARVNWMFTTEKARAKMGRAYPEPVKVAKPQPKES